ncbi:MAG: DEAD/DEAH box helicase [Muribaculaceae bacterium]|nr:DEAD/DEAH box helicase [Muribaculaceae bacterium]
MLPLQQAKEVSQSIREYIRATFEFSNEKVERAFYDFIEHPSCGMIKGPYISLRSPFLSSDPNEEIPLEIKPSFTPYVHQMTAFKRLTVQEGHQPEATLLTTGTGSGKTEAFEYPILDYCYKNRHRKGIKVIILYPMNALAADQARRLANDIWKNEKLKGEITAGLFIGTGKDKRKLPQTMGEHNIIEERNTILDTVPDILLTNFKMLDMGLIRREFAELWRYNTQDPELLKFIVLDELHTYDGAQGTDVANLIRRLKLRLNIPKEYLCPIGTSATLGII